MENDEKSLDSENLAQNVDGNKKQNSSDEINFHKKASNEQEKKFHIYNGEIASNYINFPGCDNQISICIPGLAASPPKYVSLEELIQATKGLSQMALAHEIALDKNFKLYKPQPKFDNFQNCLKFVVEQAFWDVLEDDLKEDPPKYDKVLILLKEIKEGLLSCLLPHHTRIKKQITESLDHDILQQQVQHGTVDFKAYAQYILNVMANLCAPARDECIQNLKSENDIICVFRGILDILQLMHIDMANFTIQQCRPLVEAHGIEYERTKFEDFLKTASAEEFKLTKQWLQRHVSKLKEDKLQITTRNVLSSAFVQLLDDTCRDSFPETLSLDQKRFSEFHSQINYLSILTAVLLITFSTVGTVLQEIASYRFELKKQISILLNIKSDGRELEEVLLSTSLQIFQVTKTFLQKCDYIQNETLTEKSFSNSITEISNKDHRIRMLVMISTATAAPRKIPAGLTIIKEELTELAGNFLRLTAHNQAVFGVFYSDTIEQLKHSV